MVKKYNTKNSLAFKLLKMVFSIYFLLTFFITAIHLYLEYQNSKNYVIKNIDTIIESFSKPISKAMWGFNTHQIELLTKSIINLNVLSHIEIYNEFDEVINKRKIFNKSEYFLFQKEFFHKDYNHTHYVGYALIYYKKDIIFQRVKNSFYIIIINAFIKSFILMLLLYWAFKKYLLNHLLSITKQINKIDYDSIGDKKLIIDSNSAELYNFVEKFNHMIDKLAVTKQKNHQQQNKLIQQNKLAAMGKLLEQIAHQWRQPLNVINSINGGLQFRIKNDLYEEKFFLNKLKKNGETIKYLSTTIDDFMNFYKQDREKINISIEKTIQNNLNILHPILKKNDIKTIITQKKHIEFLSFGNEFSHVIFNFLNNSIDALISSKSENKYIFLDIKEENPNIIITIKDSAGGIDKNIIGKILDPYFTTKAKSSGTGLGLYMNYMIIKEHLSGDIIYKNTNFSYKNLDLYGVEFKITIPIV